MWVREVQWQGGVYTRDTGMVPWYPGALPEPPGKCEAEWRHSPALAAK